MTVHAPIYQGPISSCLDAQILGQLDQLSQASGQDLVGELAIMFVADAEAQLVEMHRALDCADSDAVARSAHNMRGASSTLGATGLAVLCATLESESADGDLSNGVPLLGAIGLEIGLVRCAFEERAGRGSPDGAELTMPQPA